MQSASAFLDRVPGAYLPWIIVFAILTAFEILNGRERQTLRVRIAGLAFWGIVILVTLVLADFWTGLWRTLGVAPLLSLPVFDAVTWCGPLAGLVAVLLAGIVHDFFFYWYHRIQHRWLWRWHAVHHSIEDLNAVNSYHHVTETIMAPLLMQLPLSLIATDAGAVLPWANMMMWCHVVWIHSPTRFTFGRLRAVFADNRFHRIHHSLEERHFDRNFGAFTTLWDRLFGTCHFPAKDEWPAVGLAETRQPGTIREWFDLPLRHGRRPVETVPVAPETASLA